MDTTRKPSIRWNAVRSQLAAWDKPALLDLIKDLYAASEVGRDLVQARCHPAESRAETLEKYRAKVVHQFFPSRGFGKLKLGEARQAIRDYRKATSDIAGTAELLMTYVENGVDFTCQYGDIDERFYSSVESVLDELADLLRDKARELFPLFSDRLAEVEQKTDGIGWGFHDYISQVVGDLWDEFEADDAASPPNDLNP